MNDTRILSLAGVSQAPARRRVLTEGKTADVWVAVISLGDDPGAPEVFLGSTEQAVWRMLALHAATAEVGDLDDDDPKLREAAERLLADGHDAIAEALEDNGYDNFMHPQQQGVYDEKAD